MLWSDLEDGDVLRISDEARRRYEKENSLWSFVGRWLDKKIIVNKVVEENGGGDYDLLIYVRNGTYFIIKNDGTYKGTTLFEIVKLKEDK